MVVDHVVRLIDVFKELMNSSLMNNDDDEDEQVKENNNNINYIKKHLLDDNEYCFLFPLL